MIYFGSDISPKAAKKLYSLREKLLNTLQKSENNVDALNEQFWSDYIEVTLNPYVNRDLIEEILHKVMERLGLPISTELNCLLINLRKVVKLCFEQMNINIYEIYSRMRKKFQNNFYNFRQFKKEIKSYDHTFPLWEFLESLFAVQNVLKVTNENSAHNPLEKFKKCLSNII